MAGWKGWREYQEAVATAFRHLGYSAYTDQQVEGVRGSHAVDVLVTHRRHGIEINWVIECKLWNSPVNKAHVITLQGIIADVGADRGFLFSESGYQSGGERMTEASNVTLVTSLSDFIATAHADARPMELPLKTAADQEGGPSVLRLPGEKPRPQHIGQYHNLLIVGDWGSGTILFIEPTKRIVTGRIELDRYEARNAGGERKIRAYVPGSFVVAGEKLFLSQVLSDYVLAIDLPTYSIVKRIAVPGGGEGSLTATSDGVTVYFASNKSNALYEIDSRTYVTAAFPYPTGGRGSMSVALSRNEEDVYVGVQRGYTSTSADFPSGGCFLAIFDRSSLRFSASLPLYDAEGDAADSSTPACILPDPGSDRVYVGMFQGRRGVVVVETNPPRISCSHIPERNERNRHFEWVDPLEMRFHRGLILAIFRNNQEFVVLDSEKLAIRQRRFLGAAPNGPRDLTVLDDCVAITYPERLGIIFLHWDSVEGWK